MSPGDDRPEKLPPVAERRGASDREEVPGTMGILNMISNPGTTLSCAAPASAAAYQGTGLRRIDARGLSAARITRLHRTVGWTNLFGDDVAPVIADVLMAKQPKSYVPPPPPERSP